MVTGFMITSSQNEKFKLARALQTTTKIRRKEGKIALEGTRLVRDALQAGNQPLFALTSPELRDEELVQVLQEKGIDALEISDELMREVSDTQQPQGIVAVFSMPKAILPTTAGRILILDAIRDPGNLGTILRTAAAAGVEAVLLAPTCADPYNPKVLRSGMGAHFRVPVSESDWEAIGEYCSGLNIYLADSRGNLHYDQVEWSKRWALIIGSEAHGASEEARQLAPQRITIPMAASSESLNAAVATGVILFEAMQQKE